jgi:hypothetical protein
VSFDTHLGLGQDRARIPPSKEPVSVQVAGYPAVRWTDIENTSTLNAYSYSVDVDVADGQLVDVAIRLIAKQPTMTPSQMQDEVAAIATDIVSSL